MKTLKDIQKNIAGKARHATYTNQSIPDGHFAIKAMMLGFEHIYLLEGEVGALNAPIKGNIVVWNNRNTEKVELVTYRGSEIIGGERVGVVYGPDYAKAFEQILSE